jgi:hypothetical protein
MSIPIRAADGCCIETRNNRFTNPPFWLSRGPLKKEEVSSCPTKEHWRTKTTQALYTLFGRKIGEMRTWRFGGRYLTVDWHSDLRWFMGKDVFCRECKDWHFKGMKNA